MLKQSVLETQWVCRDVITYTFESLNEEKRKLRKLEKLIFSHGVYNYKFITQADEAFHVSHEQLLSNCIFDWSNSTVNWQSMNKVEWPLLKLHFYPRWNVWCSQMKKRNLIAARLNELLYFVQYINRGNRGTTTRQWVHERCFTFVIQMPSPLRE